MKIVQVINAIISNKDKISNVTRDEDEFYFLYDNKYKWSAKKNNHNDEYTIIFYPKNDVTIDEIINQMTWGNYRDFVKYSTEELKTREARETFSELIQILADKLYGIDEIFDNIIEDDLF